MFLPLIVLLSIGLLIFKLVRFRLLQFLVEKGMSSGIERVSQRIVEKRQNANTKVDCTEANDKTPSGDER